VQFSCGSFINDTPTEVVIREVRNDTEWNPEFSNEVLPFIVQGNYSLWLIKISNQ
jgi:hypothetical protein